MLYVVIGLIILVISFFIALVNLIREQGQRIENEDVVGNLNFSQELAEEVVPSGFASQLKIDNLQTEKISSVTKVNDSTPSLDEIVPFPWETGTEAKYANQIDLKKPKEAEIITGGLSLGANRDKLYGEISLSDLANK